MWCHRQSKTARGMWNMVRSLRGSNEKDLFRQLLDETGGLQELLLQLTSKFYSNFNDDNVDLSPLSDQEWNLHITVEAVYDQLSKLHCGKAMGPDQIPPRLLKIGAQFLCYPLADIFNASISLKEFPMCFKRAHVCPIPKTPNPSVCDFRPISLLSPFSKIFEKIVFEHIKHEIFACYGPDQHAYRPLGSTTSALIDICDHVTASLDSRDFSHVNMFCLDLSKAFDKLNHHRLINYLSSQGINHGCLRWLYSYLFPRTMCVKIHDIYTFGPIIHMYVHLYTYTYTHIHVYNIYHLAYLRALSSYEVMSLTRRSCKDLPCSDHLCVMLRFPYVWPPTRDPADQNGTLSTKGASLDLWPVYVRL